MPTTTCAVPSRCRFFTHPCVKSKGHLEGVRLLVLERPGIGLSDACAECTQVAHFARCACGPAGVSAPPTQQCRSRGHAARYAASVARQGSAPAAVPPWPCTVFEGVMLPAAPDLWHCKAPHPPGPAQCLKASVTRWGWHPCRWSATAQGRRTHWPPLASAGQGW